MHQTEHTGRNQNLEAETIEQALKDLAKKIKNGEIEVPCSVEFDGPGGSHFNIGIDDADAAQEISTMGFMF
jgi:hypothetical protein